MTSSSSHASDLSALTPELAEIGSLAARIVRACGWTQSMPLSPDDDQPDDAEGKVSLTEALRCAETTAGDGLIAVEIFTARGVGEWFNDEQTTTQADVENALATGRITEHHLQVVLGPAWPQVLNLTRRAASLTAEETERLTVKEAKRLRQVHRHRHKHLGRLRPLVPTDYKAARQLHDLAHEAAGEPEQGPSWTAARLVREAANYAGRGAPATALTNAAIGLATRHAVGHGSYTRDDYDQLTLPWRLAIGSLHPTDPPVTSPPR
jgi:hypothetical protein